MILDDITKGFKKEQKPTNRNPIPGSKFVDIHTGDFTQLVHKLSKFIGPVDFMAIGMKGLEDNLVEMSREYKIMLVNHFIKRLQDYKTKVKAKK